MTTSSTFLKRAISRSLIQGIFLSLVLFESSILAQEINPQQEAEVKIAEIKAEIEQGDLDIKQLQGRVDKLTSQVSSLKGEVDSLKKEEGALRGELLRLTEDQQAREAEVGTVKREGARIKQLSLARIRATYMSSKDQLLQILLKTSKKESFSFTSYYLERVQAFDRMNIDRLLVLGEKLRLQLEELSRLVQERDEVFKKTSEKSAALSVKLSSFNSTVKELKGEQKKREQASVALKAKLLRFETVLVGLTGGGLEPQALRRQGKILQPLAPKPAGFNGVGLKTGSEIRPLVGGGEVVVRFGQEIKTNSGVAGKSKGLGIQGAGGREVLAVERGKVVFIGELPVLGKVVVLDHGDRWYTLYGRLAEVTVEKDEVIDLGVRIGVHSDGLRDEGNFYFEVRRGGAPIDPQNIFKLLFS